MLKELEGDGESSAENVTYAKQQLGGGEPGGKLLGLPWDRDGDTFSVRVTVKDCTTKRQILSGIAKVYDPFRHCITSHACSKVTLSGHL